MDTNMIGSKISQARKKINISQAQLARQLFISPQAVGKWERGESVPDITTFNRLAEILGVDLNYFSEDFQSAVTGSSTVEPLVEPTGDFSSGTKAQKLSWNMSRENLADADFSGLKNLHEEFRYSNIQRCQFVGSAMSGLLLKSNNVDTCDFSGSDISSSQVQDSHFRNNLFKNCSLKETAFSGSYFEGCDFSGADLTGVKFTSGGFGNNIIANTVWNRTSFIDSQVADIVFEGLLEDCYFENCVFSRVSFQHSSLINTFFKNNRKLKQVRFIDCKADKLTYAFLKNGKADVTGITLITP